MAPTAAMLILNSRRQAATQPSPQPAAEQPENSPVSQVHVSLQKWFSERKTYSFFQQRPQKAVKKSNGTDKSLEKRVPEVVEICNC